jgi:hypothetical protein
MAKDKKSSDTPRPRKTAAKKSSAGTAAPKNSVAGVVSPEVPVSSPHLAGGPARPVQPTPTELYEEIRRRAYDFYRQRGGQHGSHEADWHRAEAEVRSKYKA